jgi:hypothetical protein
VLAQAQDRLLHGDRASAKNQEEPRPQVRLWAPSRVQGLRQEVRIA